MPAQTRMAAASAPLQSLQRAWEHLLDNAMQWAPRAALALVLFGVTLLVSRTLARHSQRVTRRIVRDDEQIAGVVATALRLLTLLVGTFVALEVAGPEAILVKIIAGAGVLGIVIGFAVKGGTNLFDKEIRSVSRSDATSAAPP